MNIEFDKAPVEAVKSLKSELEAALSPCHQTVYVKGRYTLGPFFEGLAGSVCCECGKLLATFDELEPREIRGNLRII